MIYKNEYKINYLSRYVCTHVHMYLYQVYSMQEALKNISYGHPFCIHCNDPHLPLLLSSSSALSSFMKDNLYQVAKYLPCRKGPLILVLWVTLALRTNITIRRIQENSVVTI